MQSMTKQVIMYLEKNQSLGFSPPNPDLMPLSSPDLMRHCILYQRAMARGHYSAILTPTNAWAHHTQIPYEKQWGKHITKIFYSPKSQVFLREHFSNYFSSVCSSRWFSLKPTWHVRTQLQALPAPWTHMESQINWGQLGTLSPGLLVCCISILKVIKHPSIKHRLPPRQHWYKWYQESWVLFWALLLTAS